MDNDLKKKLAPGRNKRHVRVQSFEDGAQWANTLDWKTNVYDFFHMVRSLLDRLDSHYREQFGLRVDQLVPREELLALARGAPS